MSEIVTLLTDFGNRDYFVGAMKGVILEICPDATLVDISHEVPAHDVPEAAFTLRAASACFPDGTVHIAVVDPGVGSERRGIVVSGRQQFVGPDNGIFSLVLDADPSARVHHITNRALLRQQVSGTFHGRDVFAPVAAALAGGLDPGAVGPEIGDALRLPLSSAEERADGTLSGVLLHIDRFGNCVTNFERAERVERTVASGFALEVAGVEIRDIREHYAEGAGEAGELFAIWGSAGFLEISAYCRSAASALRARVGEPVLLRGQSGVVAGIAEG